MDVSSCGRVFQSFTAETNGRLSPDVRRVSGTTYLQLSLPRVLLGGLRATLSFRRGLMLLVWKRCIRKRSLQLARSITGVRERRVYDRSGMGREGQIDYAANTSLVEDSELVPLLSRKCREERV